MTISRSALESGFSATDGTVFTTASFTPSANKLILVYISARPSASTGTASLSGNGLTWVLVSGETSGVRYSAIWRSMGVSPSAGGLTITFTDTMRNCTWEISEFDGVDTSGSNGSGAIVQSVNDDSGANLVTSLSITLASFGDATNNASYGGFTHRASEDQVEESGYTELSEQQISGEIHTGSAQWKIGEDTSVSCSWATSARAVGAACEIKIAASVGSGYAQSIMDSGMFEIRGVV